MVHCWVRWEHKGLTSLIDAVECSETIFIANIACSWLFRAAHGTRLATKQQMPLVQGVLIHRIATVVVDAAAGSAHLGEAEADAGLLLPVDVQPHRRGGERPPVAVGDGQVVPPLGLEAELEGRLRDLGGDAVDQQLVACRSRVTQAQ